MRRAGYALAALVLAGVLVSGACGSRAPVGRKVIVLGFDGLDYDLTRQMIAAGRLPGFAHLAATGGFSSLGTTIPPQSPVAWATFITGLDPGGHGIFDFVHRDPKTMLPYLSTTRTEPGGRTLGVGRWQLPLSSGRVESLRHGQPFWEVLESRGVPTTIIRMPANFPPSGTATRELSGMGTPDLTGTYGTFAFYTSEPYAYVGQSLSGGVVHAVKVRDGQVRASLEGPENPFLKKPEKVRAEFTAYLDQANRHVKITVGADELLLAVGEWSDWVPISFSLAPTQSIGGEVRFYLKGLDPFFELYASPVNIDPMDPAMPVSHPGDYAAELAAATGRFYTQGMPEDTKGLKTGVLTEAEFLAQARLAADENRRQYRYVLDRFDDGLLFYYFGNVDQVSHMMWRARDPNHPAYNAVTDSPNASVVDELYRGLDAIVSDTLATLGPDDLLVVMSDHGFTSWRRAFHMNSWLRDHGYLALIDPNRRDDPGFFGNVDWSRTRAYAVGLNGLYVNLKGRERDGIVEPAAREALVSEIAAKLLGTMDPATGSAAISKMYRREAVFHLAGNEDIAPDLVVGYAKGTRGSDESALGGLPLDVFMDNTSAWSGDHCMDHETVPGILLASRPLRRQAPTIGDLAAVVLAEFGIDGFPGNGGERRAKEY
ncbi:MAG: alkaline phosphatase family protein [Acidobacteriota bacterium]|nr:alkaline phosphatase family protein [Acidobacteriota bacterium]